MKFLTAQNIADELGVGLSTAYEIAHSLEHIRTGKNGRLIRVQRKVFDQYIEANTCDSIEEKTRMGVLAKSGGVSSRGVVSPLDALTRRPRKQLSDGSSARAPIPFTMPRKKPPLKNA